VLAGSGLAWQDDAVYEVGPRDCVIQRANELEHTFVAGAAGLEYLVFGTRHPTEIGWLPRSRAIRIHVEDVRRAARPGPRTEAVARPWVEGRDDDPWDVESASSAASSRSTTRTASRTSELEPTEVGSWRRGAAPPPARGPFPLPVEER
jgi:hypothetical protein